MMNVVSGHGINPVTSARVVPSLACEWGITSYRAPEQVEADERNQNATCSLELRRASAIGESLTNYCETGEHQDEREPHMGQNENGAVDNPLAEPSRLPKVVRYQDSLAVARHQGMDRTKQDGRGHSNGNGVRVASSNIAKAARYAAIQPALNCDYAFHELI
jgi:hypothetical protein